jgi:ribosomal protein RSM22 (predicted rRNA methylase)
MELPPLLRAAVDRALSGRRAAELAVAAVALSERYRQERRDRRLHVASARSRLHRLAKAAELSWEDEKFSHRAVSRRPAYTAAARVIARPRKGSGRVTPKLCRQDGSAGEQLFSRREGEVFKRSWRSDWGTAL